MKTLDDYLIEGEIKKKKIVTFIKKHKCMIFSKEGSDAYYILAPSAKYKGHYQLTFFIGDNAISDMERKSKLDQDIIQTLVSLSYNEMKGLK